MKNVTTICSIMLGAAAVIAMGATAIAQEGPPTGYYGGVSKAAGPSCPAIEWHIRPVPAAGATAISGVAYFADMSGISKIEGMRGADGKISGTLTSVSGSGPSGPYSGQRTAAKTHLELNGAGCSKGQINVQRMANNYANPE